MNKLDENQEKAADHFYGPALVLAGPGSGKTTVLTERTIRLVQKTKKPERILSVTFTNAAVNEMERRYRKWFESETDEKCIRLPVFKTVHSFCNYVLNEYEKFADKKFFRLTSDEGRRKIIEKIYIDINGTLPSESIVKYMLEYRNKNRVPPNVKNLNRILNDYEEYKKENNIADFDDMIFYVYAIFNSSVKADRDFVGKIMSLFDFVQIDEAQDLTHEQFSILEKLNTAGNIFIVADDDQSIYGFRGAEPRNLFHFRERYENCKIYMLSRNYRSTKNIVSYSDFVISKNVNRFDKKLYSLNEEGEKPCFLCFRNCIEQGMFVKKEINKLKKAHADLSVGILFRNNYSGIVPNGILAQSGISTKKEAGYIFTYNIPYMELLIQKLRNIERNSFFLPSPGKSFKNLLENGFEKEFENFCKEDGKEVIYASSVMLFFDYICKNVSSVDALVNLLELMDRNDTSSQICLSTIHSSKGLEFDAVFVIDMIMGAFPARSSIEYNLIEEERRLFYVAATRAKKYLYILYPMGSGNRYIRGKYYEKSIFLD